MYRKVFVAELAMTLVFAVEAHADFIVASNLPQAQNDTLGWEEVGLIAPNYNNYNNVSKGQTFIPNRSGVLTEIDALVGHGSPPAVTTFPPLQVSVFTSNAGVPLLHLATIELPKTEFSSFNASDHTRETFDFSEFQISLAAGTQYMVVFATRFGVVGTNGVHSAYLVGYPTMFMGLSASQARDGVMWERFGDIRELAIEVRAVPEPTASGLMCPVVIALGTVPGRRHANRCRGASANLRKVTTTHTTELLYCQLGSSSRAAIRPFRSEG